MKISIDPRVLPVEAASALRFLSEYAAIGGETAATVEVTVGTGEQGPVMVLVDPGSQIVEVVGHIDGGWYHVAPDGSSLQVDLSDLLS
jgi:hypothetical protein